MSEIIDEVKNDVTEHYGKIMESMGMTTTITDAYMTVFFSKEPLGLQEIAEQTGYSVSTICNTMDTLSSYTDIEKFKKPGSKKIYYKCAHDIKKAMRKKLGTHKIMIKELVRTLEESGEKLGNDKNPEAKRVQKDLEKMHKDYEKMVKVLDILITMRIIGQGK